MLPVPYSLIPLTKPPPPGFFWVVPFVLEEDEHLSEAVASARNTASSGTSPSSPVQGLPHLAGQVVCVERFAENMDFGDP